MLSATAAACPPQSGLSARNVRIEARPGWDNQVLEEMRRNIREKLRDFWDAGIRGPDFVWAATGPALEAFSKHPVVKKANEPGPMTVSEFLTHVRRMVVDFVVGRVLSGDKGDGAELAAADRLDEATAYYLLHRHDFGMDEAPAGACILYAISCGISDKELAGTWDLISFTKGKSADEAEDEESDADAEADPDAEEDSGSKVKLKTWAQRKSRSLGYEAPGGKPIPLIDRIHCLMHLWKGGDLSKVDEYLDSNGLRRHELFKRLLQSLIELSPHGSEERSLLESLSNHVQARGAVRARCRRQACLCRQQRKHRAEMGEANKKITVLQLSVHRSWFRLHGSKYGGLVSSESAELLSQARTLAASYGEGLCARLISYWESGHRIEAIPVEQRGNGGGRNTGKAIGLKRA